MATVPEAATEELLHLPFDRVGDAPRKPGIYAWYAVPNAGPQDWATADGLRRFLAFHTRRYVTPTLRLDARTTFKRSWSGSLEETTSAYFDNALGLMEEPGPAPTHDEAAKGKTLSAAVERVCADEQQREELVAALRAAIPVLASPLYVGISRNLRKRLQSHVRTFEQLESSDATEEDVAELLDEDKNFAARAFSRDFKADMLEVWCMPLELADVARADDIVKSVEFFLNRWHHPPLGRR